MAANQSRRNPLTRVTCAVNLCAVAMGTAAAAPTPERPPHPERESAAVIEFAGLAPGDKVADFLPVMPYFANLFCKEVGDKGHVYVISMAGAAATPTDTPAATPPDAPCTNVTTEVLRSRTFPAPELHSDSDDPGWVYEYMARRLPEESFVSPEPLDMIWVWEKYHTLRREDPASPSMRYVGSTWLAALKPGGILLIADHAARAGSGARDTVTLHRIEAEQVRREMIAVGFEFVSQSDLLRRERDPHTADAYRMPGETDRFLLEFRRPAR
jgi:predicted methyltransferase